MRNSIVLPVAVALSALLHAQTDWRNVTPPVPPARSHHGAAFDLTSGRTIVFGGTTVGSQLIGQTACWDGSHWSLPGLAIEPSARYGPAMAFDIARRRTLLFGGSTSGSYLADTWSWDGSRWTAVAAAGPPGRSHACMAYDLNRARIVLFGGMSYLNGLRALTDTWEWDGTAWIQCLPQQSPPPSQMLLPSQAQSMAYDLQRSRTVLISFPGPTPVEVWEWDGVTWLQCQMQPGPLPTARDGATATYDVLRSRTLLFGGRVSGSDLNDLWTWDGTALQQQLPATSVRPPGRESASFVYDLARGRMVLHGGTSAGSVLSDTWEWNGTEWNSRDADSPTTRQGHGAVTHGSTGLLFGGATRTAVGTDETWVWDGASWSRLFPAIQPQARSRFGLVHDAARQRTVLFGGTSAAGEISDTWAWDGIAWTVVAASAQPSARADLAMTYDAAHQRVVLFGGRSTAPTTMHQDTWLFDGATWTLQAPLHAPSARAEAAFAFDAARQRAVLFGGFDGQTRVGDTWAWDGIDWIARTPTTNPPARSGAVLVDDPVRARCVLSLGRGANLAVLDDTWEWDGGDWRSRTPVTRPAARSNAAAFFDPTANRTIVFGGSAATGFATTETWSYGPVQAARIAPFGSGCAGNSGMSVLRANAGSLPWLGDTLALAVEPVVANTAVVLALGFSRTTFGGAALPASLDAIGMTGCTLFVSIDATQFAFANGARADFALLVPTTTTLAGLSFYAQAAAVDAAANAAGHVVSNALEGRIGSK